VGAEELAYATYTLGYGRGLTGEPEAAQALFRESIEAARTAGDVWWQGVVRVVAASVAWAHQDPEEALWNALEGLRASRLVPDLNACAVGLNIAAVLLVGRDDTKAASLLGTADRYWVDAGGSWLATPAWVGHVDRARAQCRQNLGDSAFEEAHRAGQELAIEEAAALALGEATEPTTPEVPAGDQFGLTRREHQVASLVAEGLSSREIAARLVISPRTAETHVQNMLVKTGFATRSQLARWYVALTRG
jgi:non-specific serine/threonine protein kinase